MNTETMLIESFLHNKKYDAITESAKILYPDKKSVTVVESYTEGVRLYTDNNSIHILCPSNITENAVMEAAVANAIANGTIYDDADNVDKHAEIIRMTTLPNVAMAHKDLPTPMGIQRAITPVISKMDDEGRFNVSDADVENGVNCVKSMCDKETSGDELRRIMDNYIADHNLEKENDAAPYDAASLESDVENVKSVDADDTLSPEDYEEISECGGSACWDGNDPAVTTQEGFTHRPKKLKPIPRDTVSYVTENVRKIQDTHDQAMWASYVSNKLEFIDFYITVLDTNDERFIVPHSREYLVSMQNDFNRLLTQILQTRPVNKYDRIWKMSLPAGYEG